jgi:hypothetical protein
VSLRPSVRAEERSRRLCLTLTQWCESNDRDTNVSTKLETYMSFTKPTSTDERTGLGAKGMPRAWRVCPSKQLC